MARPKRQKTELVQTNPRYEEYSRKLTDKFLADMEKYKPMLERNAGQYDKIKSLYTTPQDALPSFKEIPVVEFSTLTDTQLEALLHLFNHNFFVEALTASELKEVFDCKRTAKVKNIGVLAYTLNQLSKQGFLADNWQHQAEQWKMFVTSKGTPLKAKKLSSKLSEFNDQITAYTDMYSEADIPRTYKAKMRLKNDIDNLIALL